MKKFIIVLGFIFSSQWVKAESLPLYWVKGDTVYYFGKAETKVDLNIFKADETNWSYLQINVDYPNSFKPQLDELKKIHPGMKYVRVLAEGMGEPVLKIDSLGLSINTVWKPRPNGPAAMATLILTFEQTKKLLSSDDIGIRVLGKMNVQMSEVKRVEEVLLPKGTCDELFLKGRRLESVLLQFAQVSSKIDQMPTRFEDTKESLKRSVLKGCLDFSLRNPIQSFSELLGVESLLKVGEIDLRGATYREVVGTSSIDFSSISSKKLDTVVGN